MSHCKYNFRNTATALLISMTLHGCQHSLQVTGQKESAATPGKSMSSSKCPLETTTPSRKRSAGALSYDSEEESPTSLANPMAGIASVSTRDTTVVITQESQKSTAMAVSLDQAVIAHAKAEPNGTAMAPEDIKDATMKTTDEANQKLSEDLRRWFQEFVEAVDDEDVLYEDVISAAIPRLVQEGKAKGYLRKSMKLVINEVGWEPDCTPLHYAAAKGNPQTVEALVREPEVVLDARTEETETTPLQCAAHEGHLEVASLLINAYEKLGKIKEIDAHDNEGTSTLQYTASGIKEDMNREVAELLVEKGADPYQLMDGDISLMDIAAVVGNSAMVEYYLEKIHDREDKESIIRSAIRLARREERANIVNILQSCYEAL